MSFHPTQDAEDFLSKRGRLGNILGRAVLARCRPGPGSGACVADGTEPGKPDPEMVVEHEMVRWIQVSACFDLDGFQGLFAHKDRWLAKDAEPKQLFQAPIVKNQAIKRLPLFVD